MVQKAASSSLVSRFSYHFSHRMDIRCFLTGFFGQEDSPDAAETIISREKSQYFQGKQPQYLTFQASLDYTYGTDIE